MTQLLRGPRVVLQYAVFALAMFVSAEAARPGVLAAQVIFPTVSDTLWEFRLADRSSVVGQVVEAHPDRLVLATVSGTRIEVPRTLVQSVRLAEGRMVTGSYWAPDPNSTRLLLVSPTGRSLERGQGYVSAFMIFFPFVGYGVTDNLTIAGGTPLFKELFGEVVYLAPKYRVFSGGTVDASIGALTFLSTERIDAGAAGIAYGVGTYGHPDRSITAGAGWLFALRRGDTFTSDRPVMMVGGQYRVARTVKLVTENFFIPGESGTLLGGGLRFFGERIAVDFGIVGFLDGGDFNWIPAGNFVYNFGKRR